ncbi:ArsR/SmtB family transcription factor [Streptomyces iconiensis]|uniref:Helix-turn-helix domain-containing protein n=1 Tax=Streptomyces iconiensis TaxID=1384038 RepID=A0ABT6ZNZ0_9ACTN|nr:helix-turn-helix domain-containing protein [Streptomyces iconiensis]MDJ1130754.1 helix-turn-helix domain-containing protein [Streptomyces iconiensis]
MLRIHFTGADLIRTQVAQGPDPLWECVFSLQILRARYGRFAFAEWRSLVRRELRLPRRADPQGGPEPAPWRAAGAHAAHRLLPLVPDASYFPDFLTPPEGLLGLEAGIEAVSATPAARVGHELGILHDRVGAPDWARELAGRSSRPRAALGRMLADYHRLALAPYWPRILARAQADRAVRMRALHAGGPDALLRTFRPGMRWTPPVLGLPGHPVDRDLHLGGRGLLLIPSHFCWGRPVPLADPELPPTLVYPMERDPQWLSGPTPAGRAMAEPRRLARLLGETRSAVLGAVAAVTPAGGATTTGLAERLGVSPSAVSQQTSVLREAGLLTSRRHANCVFHHLTPLGEALLGETPRVGEKPPGEPPPGALHG